LCFSLVYIFVVRKNLLAGIKQRNVELSLFALFAVAFVARLVISGAISGLPTDISCFTAWAVAVYESGFTDLYLSDMFLDYPPGYMYVLYPIGYLRTLLVPDYENIFWVVLKLPSILTDIILCVMIYKFGVKKLGPVKAAFLSALYAINPIIILDSTMYGQADSFFTFFIVLTAYYLYKDKVGWASFNFTLALLIKPQALIFPPMVLLWLIDKRKLKYWGQSIAVGAVTFTALVLPFAVKLEPLWIFKHYYKTLISYAYASINAFNLFGLFGANWIKETETFLIFSYANWSTFFIYVIVGTIGYLHFRSREKSFTFFTPYFLASAVYVLCSMMHERYLYPAIIFSLLVAIFSNDRRFLYVFLSFTISLYIDVGILLDLALRKNEYWIPNRDINMIVFSITNLLTFFYSVYVAYDIFIKKNIKAIEGKG
jgi:Gpi18-like mannosyltransferase